MAGRLASTVAKLILNGQKVVVVRCEDINISGSFFRNKLKYSGYLKKRCVVNPKRGPFHFRAPSRMLYRMIRGMVPHKTPRGAAALDRLKVFEGVPAPYDKVKKMVVHDAVKVLRLKPHRKFTSLGKLANEFGWKYAEVVKKLEEKRITDASKYHEEKKAKLAAAAKAKQTKASELAPVKKTLESYGYTL